MNSRIVTNKPLSVAPAQYKTLQQEYLKNRYLQRMASVMAVPNPTIINPNQPAPAIKHQCTMSASSSHQMREYI